MDASWRHHDFGYAIGGDEFDRIRCDWKFLVAMMRDSVSQPRRTWLVAAPLAMMLSLFFFLAVLLMGWNGSFRYSDRYATIEEIRDWSRI